MKKYAFFIILLCVATLFGSCEKAYDDYEDEDDDTEIVDNPGDAVTDDADDDKGGGSDVGNDDESTGGVYVDDVVNVEDFISKPIANQVWLKGYIVGAATGANGKKRYDFEAPYSYDTALLLADDPEETDLSHVVSVCLTSCSKKIREKLNLKDHPENRGRVLSVYGYRETYLGIPGVKTIDGYEFNY